MVVDVLKNVENRFLVRSEQILTQEHLVEQRMQPVLLVDLGHRGHLAILLVLVILQRVLLNALVHSDGVAGERPLCRHVLLFDLRLVLLRLGAVHFYFSLFVLDVLVGGDPHRLIIDSVHVLIDTDSVCAALCCLQSGQLRTHNLH